MYKIDNECLDILNRDLPKNPMLKIRGLKITPEQAKEIIRRTDVFFTDTGGNNYEWIEKVCKTLGHPCRSIFSNQEYSESWEDYKNNLEEWNNKWGTIRSNCLENDWISSWYINGPTGWVHHDGTIAYHYNVGKYPTGEEILNDLYNIAKAFPYLEMTAVAYDREHGDCDPHDIGTEYYLGEAIPIIGYLVKDGEVSIYDPLIENYLDRYPNIIKPYWKDVWTKKDAAPRESKEIGIPIEWLDDWALRLRA